MREIADEPVASGRDDLARRLADGWNAADGPLPALDARRCPVAGPKQPHSLGACDEDPHRVVGYPPVVVGGLGRHGTIWRRNSHAAGHEVVVLSRRPSGTDASTHPTVTEIADGVLVVAVAEDPTPLHLRRGMLAWTLAMGHAMSRAPASHWRRRASARAGSPTSCTPWMAVGAPAIALAEFYDVPLVSTLHASEAGRHSGWISGRINRQVHSVEWWLANESDSIITCSASMHDEVTELYGPDCRRSP